MRHSDQELEKVHEEEDHEVEWAVVPAMTKKFGHSLHKICYGEVTPEGFVGRTIPAQEGDWSEQENIEDWQAESGKSAVVKEQRQTSQHIQQEHSSVVCTKYSN